MNTTATTTHIAQKSAPKQANDIVRACTEDFVRNLAAGYRAGHADAAGMLARIRRAAGKPIQAVPDLWGLTGADVLYTQIKDPARLERAENAVHIAITLFALHQQSLRESPMHVSNGPQLGRALRDLMEPDVIDESIRRRFVRVGTAPSLSQLAQRLREVITLLRNHARPLDYAALAEQLYRWQHPAQRSAVQREWGRSFYARPRPARPAENTPTTPQEP